MWSINLLYAYSVTLIDNMGTFDILADILFLWSEIYQLESIKVFSCSKMGHASVWLHSEMLKRNHFNKRWDEVTNLTKNDDPFYSKIAQLKILNVE